MLLIPGLQGWKAVRLHNNCSNLAVQLLLHHAVNTRPTQGWKAVSLCNNLAIWYIAISVTSCCTVYIPGLQGWKAVSLIKTLQLAKLFLAKVIWSVN